MRSCKRVIIVGLILFFCLFSCVVALNGKKYPRGPDPNKFGDESAVPIIKTEQLVKWVGDLSDVIIATLSQQQKKAIDLFGLGGVVDYALEFSRTVPFVDEQNKPIGPLPTIEEITRSDLLEMPIEVASTPIRGVNLGENIGDVKKRLGARKVSASENKTLEMWAIGSDDETALLGVFEGRVQFIAIAINNVSQTDVTTIVQYLREKFEIEYESKMDNGWVFLTDIGAPVTITTVLEKIKGGKMALDIFYSHAPLVIRCKEAIRKQEVEKLGLEKKLGLGEKTDVVGKLKGHVENTKYSDYAKQQVEDTKYSDYAKKQLELANTGSGELQAMAMFNLGVLYEQGVGVTRDLEQAKFWYKKASAAYSLSDQYEEAIKTCKQAIKIKPYDADVYVILGHAYLQLGRYDEAIESFKQAIRVKPDYAEAYNGWGSTFLYQAQKKQGEVHQQLLAEAKEKCLKAESIETGSGAYSLACVCALTGDKDNCRKWLKVGEQAGTLTTRKHAMTDTDLESVRNEEWFKQIRWSNDPK